MADRTLAIDAALASGVALVLGLVQLGGPALWFDEAYTVRQLDRSVLEQLEGYQPFYYWLIEPWIAVAGMSEWALRFPSVAGAMLSCALVVVLARRFFDRWTALLSGVLLASSPFFVKWSQQARTYPLIVAACLIATLLLLRALDDGSPSAWALYGIAYAVILVWHGAIGLFFAPAHVVLILQRRERVLPHGLLAAAIVLAFGGTWLAQLAMRTDDPLSETAWIPFPSVETVARAVFDISGIGGLGVLFALAGIWTLRRAGHSALAVWLGAWAFAPFAIAFLISVGRHMFLDRYLSTAAPAFAMLAAVAIMALPKPRRAAAGAVAVVATGLGLWFWYTADEHGNWRGEDWRGAATMVNERRAEADAVVVVPWWANDAAEYYGAGAVDVSTADRIWVVMWSETGHDLSASARRPLGFGEHERLELHPFGWRVSAQLWQRPG